MLHGIAAFSTDNRDTASSPTGAALLAQGNRVDLRHWTGSAYERFWPPLYILKTVEPVGLDKQPIAISVGDVSLLGNSQQPGDDLAPITPENDYSRISLGVETAPHSLINAISSAAGMPTTSDIIDNGYNLSAPAPKNNTGDWPTFIGEIAACQGYVAWLNKDEELRLTPIDLDKPNPNVSLVIGQDEVGENGWVPRNFDERPPGKLTVTGGGGIAKEIQNPRVIPRTVEGDGFMSLRSTETTTITPGGGAPQTETIYEERQAERQIRPTIAVTETVEINTRLDPEDNGGSSGFRQDFVEQILELNDNTATALRDSKENKINLRYNGITGALTRSIQEIKEARGLAGGDAYRLTEQNQALTISTSRRLTTEYKYDNATGRIRERKITEVRPWCLFEWGKVRPVNYELNRFLERDYYSQTTTWTRVLNTSGDPTIEAWEVDQETLRPRGVIYSDYAGSNPEVLIPDPDPRLTFKTPASDGSTEPPKTEYQESIYTRDDREFSGSVKITPLSGNAHKLKDGVIRVQAPVIGSSAQCSFLAELYAKWQHGLSLGWSFIGAIPSEFFAAFGPISRFDVTDRGVISAYFLNGFTIASNSEETLFGCNLGLIGEVGQAPDEVTAPINVSFVVEFTEELPAIEDNPIAVVIEQGVINNEQLPAIEDTPVVTGVGGSTSNNELFPSLQDNPSAVEATSVINTESLPNIEDASSAIEVVVTPTGNTESLPAIQDNPSAIEAASDLDANAFITARSGTYSRPELDAIEQFFVTMKTDGLYAKAGMMLLLAADNEADGLIWMNNPSTSAINNGASFTAREGFTGNGSNAYIDTGFNPASGANYTLNSASLGVYIRTNISEDAYDIGAQANSSNDRNYVISRWGDGNHYAQINDGSGGSWTVASSSDSRGFWLSSRTSATFKETYQNAVSQDTDSSASDGLASRNIYVLALNNGGVRAGESSKQVGFVWIGGGLSEAEISALNTRVTTLLTAFGANI
nr:hypothetical protein [Adonisia turfae]